MTPERRKYLDNISRDEKTARHFLEIYSSSMKHLKSYLNTSDYKDIKSAKNAIAETKAVIKMLKKQLPAPRKPNYDYNYGRVWFSCMKCKKQMFDNNVYCGCCGQKLR